LLVYRSGRAGGRLVLAAHAAASTGLFLRRFAFARAGGHAQLGRQAIGLDPGILALLGGRGLAARTTAPAGRFFDRSGGDFGGSLGFVLVADIATRPLVARAILTGPVVTGPVVTGPVITGPVITGPVITGTILARPVAAVAITFAARLFGARLLETFAFVFEILAVVFLVVALATLVLFLKASAAFVQNAEIMIGELQIIFAVHPVALRLRVASQILVFFKQLGGIATRPIVDAVAIIGTIGVATLRALPATTATAAGLTIVHQDLCVLSLPCPPTHKADRRA
jgi:hypothetical protein